MNKRMTLTSEYSNAFIELDILALETEYSPSVNLAVTVQDSDFRGANPSILVDGRDWDAFVQQLRQCAETRRGSASLASMSPGELELTIESSDLLGHFTVRYTVSRFSDVLHTLSGSFDLNVSHWPLIAAQFSLFADLAALRNSLDKNKGEPAEPPI